MKMIIRNLLLLAMAATGSCFPHALGAEGSLAIQPSADWKLKHYPTGGVESYTLEAASGKGWMMMHEFAAPMRPEEFPVMVRKFADGFIKQVKKSAEYTLTDEQYDIEAFVGDHCKGSYATVRYKSADVKIVRVLFTMSVDGQVWSGQFAGTIEQWPQMFKLLKTIRKNDRQDRSRKPPPGK